MPLRKIRKPLETHLRSFPGASWLIEIKIFRSDSSHHGDGKSTAVSHAARTLCHGCALNFVRLTHERQQDAISRTVRG